MNFSNVCIKYVVFRFYLTDVFWVSKLTTKLKSKLVIYFKHSKTIIIFNEKILNQTSTEVNNEKGIY